MKVKFYNGIKKLKNKVSLIKENITKKVEKCSFIKDFKKTSTKVVLGVTLTAVLLSNLAGCGVGQKTQSIYDYNSSYTQTEFVSPSTKDPSMVQQGSDVSLDSSTGGVVSNDYSLSYNRFLYGVNDDLNTIVKTDLAETSKISKSGNHADRRLATGEYIGSSIEITDNAYNNFINMIDHKDVIYTYEDYYNIDEALNMTGAVVGNVTHSHLIADINEEITLNQLVNVIIANNTEYLKQYPEFTELPNEDIIEFAQYIILSLESEFKNLTDKSKERVYCELGNLKVVGFDSSDPTLNPGGSLINAQYCSDGTVVIDKKQIAKLPDADARAKTFKHEVNHIYHRCCEDQLHEGSEVVGISQFYDDLDVNSLFWRWQYEAAAESMVMSEYKTPKAVVYQNFVNYLRSLDLIALINPNYDERALELSTLNQNPEDIFKIFGAETLEEKKEIIMMMYSIDYIQIHREDLDQEYENRTGESIGESLQVKYEMKKSLCTTMAKYFYKNLAERVKNVDVTLEDVFYLINVFEADLNTHILYDEEKEVNRYFMEEYIKIQDEFFNMLASDINYSTEGLLDLFNIYAMIIRDSDGIYKRNVSFSWLDDGERQFVYDLLTHNIGSFTVNIRNLYDIEQHQYIGR